MKKWFLIFFGFSLVFTACKKDSNSNCTYTESSAVAPANEVHFLDSALTADGISNAIQHPSGVFYTIDSTGNGIKPGICTVMNCTYSGYLYGHTIPFDAFTDSLGTSLTLGSLVVGWQKVLPLVPAGSKLTLYIPPSLGYGTEIKRNGDGDIIIPANSYLTFTIHFINVL